MTLFYPPDEAFGRLRDRDQQAGWLLTAAPADLDRCESGIRRHLHLTGHHEALPCLDRMLRAFRSPRRADGGLADLVGYSIACGRLARVRDGLMPLGMGEWWP